MIASTIIGYVLIGILSAFSYMVLIHYHEYTDEFVCYVAPVFIALIWPVALPILAVVILIQVMSKISKSTANRIKNKR